MCGFLSVYFKNNSSLNSNNLINRNFKKFSHRGPDNTNIEKISIDDNTLFIGHHRLSIIDLNQRSNQPMNSKDSRYKIIFNGEIYNHNDLRNELNSLYNISWDGTSDTETLLYLLIHFPIEIALNKLIGMFSFVFLDLKEKKITIARDRAGEKPLYFGINKNFLGLSSDLFGFSDLIDFKKNINNEAFQKYLQYNYVPSPLSIINGIFKLPASSFAEIKINKILLNKYNDFNSLINSDFINFNYYWKIEDKIDNQNLHTNSEDIIKNIESLIDESVKSQLISDVPVGAFLSGGNDSALIVANMQKYQKTDTFTIGFDEKEYDESINAKQISKILNTNHNELICNKKDAQNLIPKIQAAFSEPFADSSQIPTMLVSKLASNKVKVALSGDGGDEVFGGYNRYIIASKYWNLINIYSLINNKYLTNIIDLIPNYFFKFLLKKNLSNYSMNSSDSQINSIKKKLKEIKDEESFYESMISQYPTNHKIFNNLIKYQKNKYLKFSNDFVNNLMISDFKSYLPDDILCKVDRSSMFYSLELRSPYLDKRILEYSYSLPSKIKLKNNISKVIIKSILEKYIPKEIIYNKKSGFSIPISSWIKKDLRDWSEELLNKKTLEKHNLLNYKCVKLIKDEHFSNIKNNEHKLWSIIQFNSWYENL